MSGRQRQDERKEASKVSKSLEIEIGARSEGGTRGTRRSLLSLRLMEGKGNFNRTRRQGEDRRGRPKTKDGVETRGTKGEVVGRTSVGNGW